MTRLTKLWIGILFIKLVLGAWLPLFSDENYYWFWSHHLQLSYYDHPPFVAWLFWLGHPFEAWGQAVRWPAIIFGHCTLLILLQLIKPYCDEKKRELFLIFFSLNPLIGWGSLAVLPDTPLLFFWCLSLWFLLQLLRERIWIWAAGLGASLGLGFCSKYHIIVFVLVALAWLAWTRQWRQIKTSWFFLIAGVGLLFSLPVIIWNAQHDWDSFLFQLHHGLGVSTFEMKWPVEYLAAQFGLIFPATIWVLFTNRHRRGLYRDVSWFYFFGLGPLIFFFLTSFKGRPEANWPSVAYPALLGLSFALSESTKWARNTALLWGTLLLLVVSEVIYPWIPSQGLQLKTSELTEYDPLIEVARTHQPFFASSLQMASTLSYKLKSPVYKLKGIGRRDYFDYLDESLPTGKYFFVVFRRWDTLPDWAVNYQVSRTPINSTFTLLEVRKN